MKAHSNVVTALRFSGDSKFLFSGAYDDPVIAWKISGPVNKPLFTISKKIVRSGHDLEDIQTFGNTVLVTEENQITKYSLPSMIQKGISKNYKGRITSIAVNSSKIEL
ncbi:MAG: hypothetical protein IPP43_10765 [Chitinophagaceae bacterium]|nr:hypothetical protein [Chitinophagaceae bacterium]